MDIENLIEQVTQEVLKCTSKKMAKKEILLVTQSHGRRCHEILEKVPSSTCHCDLEGRASEDTIHTLILLDVTNTILYKLAHGCDDSRYLKAVTNGLLTGKKIIIIKEEIECFKYEKTAPKLYFKRFLEYIDFLKQCGVVIVTEQEIMTCLKGEEKVKDIETTHKMLNESSSTETSYKITKKLITDKDIQIAVREGARVIETKKQAIITELAKDSITAYNIQIVMKN